MAYAHLSVKKMEDLIFHRSDLTKSSWPYDIRFAVFKVRDLRNMNCKFRSCFLPLKRSKHVCSLQWVGLPRCSSSTILCCAALVFLLLLILIYGRIANHLLCVLLCVFYYQLYLSTGITLLESHYWPIFKNIFSPNVKMVVNFLHCDCLRKIEKQKSRERVEGRRGVTSWCSDRRGERKLPLGFWED